MTIYSRVTQVPKSRPLSEGWVSDPFELAQKYQWTLERLAEELNVTYSTVSKWMRPPTSKSYRAITDRTRLQCQEKDELLTLRSMLT